MKVATRRFTDAWLRGLKPAGEGVRDEWIDEAEIGLVATINHRNRITFWLVARFPKDGVPGRNPMRCVLGDYKPADPKGRLFVVKKGVETLTLDEARQKAREWKSEIAEGRDPRMTAEPTEPAPVETVGSVFDVFFKRHVKKVGQKDGRGMPVPPLRSAGEIKRIFDRYVLADLSGKEVWRSRPIDSITRREVTTLLDAIQDSSGAVQADAVLSQLSKLFNWHAARGDDFVSPIVKGMRRSKPAERKRKRVLGDHSKLRDAEIRIFWEACEQAGIFGAFCRFALLTGQRREKIIRMKWTDLGADGLWTIPTEAREKGNAELLYLSPLALKVIRNLPRAKGKEFVFQGKTDGPINGFTKDKARLDASMKQQARDSEIQPWTLHDLRRTAKTLMARAGVTPHDSERVLGHDIDGVEGVYDRHAYLDEKRRALRKLSTLVQRVVKPPAKAAGKLVPPTRMTRAKRAPRVHI